MIHDLTGPTPRHPQAGREQAGGVEPALLKPHHRRDPTVRAPLTRMTRQLTTGGQARRRQGLTPRRPRHQPATGRRQLPQTPRPQTKQPSSTSLLQRHDPVSLSGSHQRRVSTRLAGEQGRRRITISSATLTVTTFIAATVAVVVVVLGGDQQPGQQPLHHTGQRSASGQGPQQARHALRAGHGLRRRVPARRTQHPGRTTGRDTRKHTTFEHMYSIARSSAPCTLKQPPRITGTATKTQGVNLLIQRRTETGRPSRPGLTPTPRTNRTEATPPKPTHLNRPTGLGKPVRDVRSGWTSSGTQVREGWVRGYRFG